MSELGTALVTGATSGIGRAFAARLAGHGWDLALVGRDAGLLEGAREQLTSQTGVSVRLFTADLTRAGAPAAVLTALGSDSPGVDLLVNAAGSGDAGPFAGSDWDTQESLLRLHVLTTTRLTHLVLPGMLARRRGWILNVASTAAFRPGPLMAVYSAAKAYVLSFSEALASELRGTGVTVTVLCPGPTRTNFQARTTWRGARSGAHLKLADPADVAAFGYSALMHGQTVAIHGVRNRMLAASLRFLPRDVQTALVHRVRRPRSQAPPPVPGGRT